MFSKLSPYAAPFVPASVRLAKAILCKPQHRRMYGSLYYGACTLCGCAISESDAEKIWSWMPYQNSQIGVTFVSCLSCDGDVFGHMKVYVDDMLAKDFPSELGLDYLKPSTESVGTAGKRGTINVHSVSRGMTFNDGAIEWANGLRECEGMTCVLVTYRFYIFKNYRCSEKWVPVSEILRLNPE